MSEQVAESPESSVEGGDVPAVPGLTARQALLQRQRELEVELAHVRQVAVRARRGAGGGEALAIEPEEESWLMTYLDMMTLMLVLLVVMLSYAGQGSFQGMKEAVGGLMREGQGILPAHDGLLPQAAKVPTPQPLGGAADPLKGLPLDQLGDDIDVVVNESTVSFRISSEILFASGQADLSLEGLAVLRRLIPVFSAGEQLIAVEGHTDSVPMRSGRYPSNWELSGSRAGSVVRYLEANGVASRRLRAVGYADTRPLADNATAEGRASNRRVELIMETPDP